MGHRPAVNLVSARGASTRRKHADRMGIERWLSDLEVSKSTLEDPRAVHRLRVALERLRIWAVLADAPGLPKELRWARERAAAVRDIDVCLALRPRPAIAAALRQARPTRQRRLERALASRRFALAIDTLRSTPPPPNSRVARRARKLVDRALAKAKRMRRHRWTSRSVHELRRSLRRSRYALEWLGQPCGNLGALQQALGAVCDRRMAIRQLRDGPRGRRRDRSRLASELAVLTDAARSRRTAVRTALKEARRNVLRRRREDT